MAKERKPEVGDYVVVQDYGYEGLSFSEPYRTLREARKGFNYTYHDCAFIVRIAEIIPNPRHTKAVERKEKAEAKERGW